jgi:ribosomal protein L17
MHPVLALTHKKIGMQLKRIADEIVTIGKQGTLFARRRAQAVVRSEATLDKVFEVLAPRYKDRTGGYTRVLRFVNLYTPTSKASFASGYLTIAGCITDIARIGKETTLPWRSSNT